MTSSWLPRLVTEMHRRLVPRSPWAEVRRLRALQWQAPELVEAEAVRRLRALLAHAFAHVPRYRRLSRELGIDAGAFGGFADLQRLPPIAKAEQRTLFPAGVTADNRALSGAVKRVTGGSTGTPLEFYADRGDAQRRLGTYLLFREWAGVGEGDARLHVASPTHFAIRPSRIELLMRRLLLGERLVVYSGAALDPQEVRRWVAGLGRGRQYFLWTYPSYAARLAAEIDAGRLSLPAWPKVVISYAETLTELNAANIARAFRCRVVNLYSSMEVPLMAVSCPDEPRVMHCNSQRAIVRVIRDDGSDAAVGERGRVVVTDLANYIMPFINYEIGDWAVAGGPCSCGRGFPTLARLEGRSSEVIRTVVGRQIAASALSGFLLERCAAAVCISEYQAVQTGHDTVVLRVVPTPAFTAEVASELQRSFAEFLGADMRVTVEAVQAIATEPSGKRLVIKSELPRD